MSVPDTSVGPIASMKYTHVRVGPVRTELSARMLASVALSVSVRKVGDDNDTPTTTMTTTTIATLKPVS